MTLGRRAFCPHTRGVNKANANTVENQAAEALRLELARVQRELGVTRAELEFTQNSAQVGYWDLDLFDDTSRRSPRHDQCFGYDAPIPEEAWGIEAFRRHIHPDDRDRVIDSLRQAVRGLLDWSAEFRVVWPDGSLHWLSARGSIYRTTEGHAERMLGLVMDITDRKRAEEILVVSERIATSQVEALRFTLDALANDAEPDRLAQYALRTVTEQLGAHSSSVWRLEPSTGMIGFEFAFEGGAFVRKGDNVLSGLSLALPMDPQWPWPNLLQAGEHCLMLDISEVPPFPLRDRLVDIGIVTVMMVPMIVGGRLEGAISIRFAHRRAFRPEEVEFAKALASQVVLAMQLTRVSLEAREAAVLSERNRLARDIHDTLAQGFTGVIVQLEAARDAKTHGLDEEVDDHLRRASALARDSLNEARRSVQALRPLALERHNLCDALSELLGAMTAGSGMAFSFDVTGEPRPLPADWEEGLLRVGQEAVTNALRHARASLLTMAIHFEPAQLRLEFRDNGRGLDRSRTRDGFGLMGMRERVEQMGGNLVVRSAPDPGVALLISLPMPS